MPAIQCPSCGKTLNVGDQYAGKKVRCPSCQGVLTVPPLGVPAPASEEVMPIPRAPRPAMPPVPPEAPYAAPRPVQQQPDYYDDRPRRGPRRDDDYPDPRLRRRGGQQWAPCPGCGGDEGTKIGWTFWGGWLGPAIINCVRCHRCGVTYNGVHGDYNGGRIAIYMVVSIILGLVAAGVVIALSIANS